MPTPLRFVLVSLGLAALACDGPAPTVDAFVPQPDAGPPLAPSTLFGPCVEDWQCPGEGAVCRLPADGWPNGYCTVPCEDRTPCDYNGVYHHCATREGETQSYCERRCLNGLDCGRSNYTCVGQLPPSGGACAGFCSTDEECGSGLRCNAHSGACVEGEVPSGAATGEPCSEPEDCLSGQCVLEVNDSGTPTGWIGGYCLATCLLPSGYNNNDFFAGDALPRGSCADEAICYPDPGQLRGDLGTCYDACTADADCREGYTCLKEFPLASGDVSRYSNGLCIPGDCAADGCPVGYECVTVQGTNGPRSVCSPL